MSFQLNLPPSVIRQMAKEEPADAEPGGEEEAPPETVKKREDWKKLKELEEARKAGTAPAMKDEEGRDINPHIPQYIMQAPWYFGATQATLNHQRQQDDKVRNFSKNWYKKGVQDKPVATKFRKGACENCGAMTHKKKDCLERPRKLGAKYTGADMAPDEHVQQDFDFDYDGKRDRWNGYDTVDHSKIVEEFQKIDEAKRLLKAQRMEESVPEGEQKPEDDALADDDAEEDEDKYADDVDMPGQKFETKQRITVRNLRIREDTAKYLYNLNVDSAYYDPKTRAMRDNPFRNTGKQPKELPYAGDNFTRWTGEAMDMAKQQLFAWEAYEKGSDVNLQADPTKLDMLTREYGKKKEGYKQSMKDSILEKYGGQEHLENGGKRALLAQSEDYVEYSRTGAVVKGLEKAKVKSRYVEDVYLNNHTCVWGSFWKDGQWGYKCCHAFIKESYCTGSAGKQLQQQSIISSPEAQKGPLLSPDKAHQVSPLKAIMPAANDSKVTENTAASPELTEEEKRKLRKKEKKKLKKQKEKERKRNKKNKKKKKKRHSSSSNSDQSESSDSESDDEATKREKRIMAAIKKEEDRLADVDRQMMVDERKRKYNVTYDITEPTEEDIEAYQRKRARDEDPMAQFM